ncbi:MAG: D-2-hydroxyacid dehydrogenase [Ruminococcaceae bacterium]|nr:D-2-hydroxyacid dehydrogenase [Oscillospiraceae bacterium]
MKIVITDGATVTGGDLSFDIFKQFGEVVIYDLTAPEEIAERIKDADIVLCNKTPMTAEVMKDAKNLKYIGLFATGFNNVDLEYTKSHNIIVCNVPSYSTEAVAQHTFALILELLCRVSDYNKTVKEGDWVKSRTFSYFPIPLFELSGKTIGLVGLGSIGTRVADIALAFGMKVIAYKRSKVTDERIEQVTFDELLKRSDIVSLHCPLNKDSENLMNSEAFAKMKDGAVFINTARGGMVDEIALRNALTSGKLLGAGLDVLRKEPIDKDCPLLNVENCIITPHIAWAGLETRKRLMGVVTSNIKAFIDGKPINTV